MYTCLVHCIGVSYTLLPAVWMSGSQLHFSYRLHTSFVHLQNDTNNRIAIYLINAHSRSAIEGHQLNHGLFAGFLCRWPGEHTGDPVQAALSLPVPLRSHDTPQRSTHPFKKLFLGKIMYIIIYSIFFCVNIMCFF